MKRKQSTQQSYVISISLYTGCYRHIRICANDTLYQLSDAILDAFGFDNDHMHAFFMDNQLWKSQSSFFSVKSDPETILTSSVHLCQLELPIGKKFKYLFDFGDEWTFQCRVLKLLDEPTKEAVVVRSVGTAPQQYEDMDFWEKGSDEDSEDGGEWDEDDEDDGDDWDESTETLQSIMSHLDGGSQLTISDELYEKAFQFRQTKLWLKLLDSELFAVRHGDQSIGYCCVTGMLGEHLSLAVYPGAAGIASYRKLTDIHDGEDDFEMHERLLSPDCVMLSFENKIDLFSGELEADKAHAAALNASLKGKFAYPHFLKHSPCCYPWYITDASDQQHLLEALDAALDVADKLATVTPETAGFTDGAPYHRSIPLLEKAENGYHWSTLELPEPTSASYPAANLLDEVTLARLAKVKPRGEWICDVMLQLEAIADADIFEVPFCPYMLLLLNASSGNILIIDVANKPDQYADQFGMCLAETALRFGKPKKIWVNNDRALALLKPLAKQIGVALVYKASLPVLASAKKDLKEQIDELDGNAVEEGIMRIAEVLANPEVYKEMPDDILKPLYQAAERGVFSNEIFSYLKSEIKKRGI